MTDDILDLFNDPSISPEAAQMGKQILLQEQNAKSFGIDPEEAKPRDSVLMRILDVMQIPVRASEGVLDAALFRKDLGSTGLLGAAKRGIDEKISFSDILRRQGYDEPIGRGVSGFVMDVALDPLSYLTLGTSAAARVAGKALAPAGQALKSAAEVGLAARGIEDASIISKTSEDAFRAISTFQDGLKSFHRAEKAGSLDMQLAAASKMSAARDAFLPYIQAAKEAGSTINEADIPTLFQRFGIRVGADVPFLGHFTGDTKSVIPSLIKGDGPIEDLLVKDPGLVKKSLAAVGEAIGGVTKPGRVDLVDFDLPEPWLRAAEDAAFSAKEIMRKGLVKLSTLGEQAAELPVVGPPLALLSMGVEKLGYGAQAIGKALQSTFARKMFEGAENRSIELERRNLHASSMTNALRETSDRLGKWLYTTDATGKLLENKAGRDLLEEAGLHIDSMAMDPVREAFKSGALQGKTDDLLEAINKAAEPGSAARELSAQDLAGDLVESGFRSRMQLFLQDPAVTDDVKEAVQAIVSTHDELFQKEARAGIKYNFVDSYLMHRYTNGDKVHIAAGGAQAASFAKHRKFSTLAEALDAGLVGNIDTPTLVAKRIDASTRAIANKNYFNRMVLQNGMPSTVYSRIAQDAAKNPEGPEAMLLRRDGFRVPANVTEEELARASKIAGIEGAHRARYIEHLRTSNNPDQLAASILSGLPTRAPQEMVEAVYDGSREMSAQLNRSLDAQSLVRHDFNLPELINREVADEVVLHNGEKVVLPIDVARALKENLASRDIIKDFFGQSEIGKKFLRLSDASTNFFKSFMTIPFPGYYYNNLLGAAFFSAADGGISALDPGLISRAFQFISGKTALRIKGTNAVYTPQVFAKFLKERGFRTSANDIIDAIDAAGRIDARSVIQSQRGILENLSETGSRSYALRQAHQKLEDKFDGFPRIVHMVHRLEKGDTLEEAFNRSNELLINYRDMSPVERSLFRRMYMFYGWLSKSTKKSLTSLITQPGDVLTQIKAARGIAETFSDPNALPTMEDMDNELIRSNTMAEQLSYAIGHKDGKRLIARGFGLPITTLLQSFSVNAPRSMNVGELVNAGTESIRRTVQKQFAAANPAINAIAQQVSGKNLYFDKPLNATFLRRLPSFEAAGERLAPYAHTAIPAKIGKEIDSYVLKYLDATPDGEGRLIADPGKFWVLTNLIPGMSRALSSVSALSNKNVDPSTSLLPLLTGVRIEEGDPERTQLSTYADRLSQLMADRNYALRKKTGFTGPE